MNDRPDFESRLASAFAAYADRAPVEVDPISLTAATAHGATRRRWSLPGRATLVLVGTVLALLLLGAAVLVGARLLRPPTTLGGGGPMIVAQVDAPLGVQFASATAMHVFALDVATGERVALADWSLNTLEDGQYGPAWAKWSPDRQHALLFDPEGTGPRIVDLTTRRLTVLGPPPGVDYAGGERQMAWGPASDRIAIVAFPSSLHQPEYLLIVDPRGREITHLAMPYYSASARQPAWSPDGSSILVESDGRLSILPTDGSGARVLLESVPYGGGEVWSPDGSTIAYTTPDGIATMVVAQGRQVLLTHGQDRQPAWSPDGRRIAFARLGDDGLSQGIHVVDADGTLLTQLTDGHDQTPDWSPDGGSLLFSRAGDPGYPGVWVVSADGGEPYLLLTNATSDW